jgi:hypothetical protein
MKFAKKSLNNIALLVAALVLAILGFGCASTVRPEPVTAKAASFDGGSQNSGIIAFDTAKNGILTPHARDRYNDLVAKYGTKFSPELHNDSGLSQTTTNTYLIDPQHLVYFTQMNRWSKSTQIAR